MSHFHRFYRAQFNRQRRIAEREVAVILAARREEERLAALRAALVRATKI